MKTYETNYTSNKTLLVKSENAWQRLTRVVWTYSLRWWRDEFVDLEIITSPHLYTDLWNRFTYPIWTCIYKLCYLFITDWWMNAGWTISWIWCMPITSVGSQTIDNATWIQHLITWMISRWYETSSVNSSIATFLKAPETHTSVDCVVQNGD